MADLSRFDVLAEWRNTSGTVLSVWCNAPRCVWHHDWGKGDGTGNEGRADLVLILRAVEGHPSDRCPFTALDGTSNVG